MKSKNKTRLMVFLQLAGLLLYTRGYGGETFTLEDCIDYGLKNSPAIQGARIRVQEAEDDIKTARGDFLPSVSASYSYTNLSSLNARGAVNEDYLGQVNQGYNVGLSQILYAGAGLYAGYRKAEANRDMKIAAGEMAELDLIFRIKTAFYQLLKAKQDIRSLEQKLERLESGLEAARAYLEQKMIPYVQVLQAEVDLAGAKQELSMAGNTVERGRSRLLELLNLPQDGEYLFMDDLQPSSFHVPVSFDAAWTEAEAKRPDLKMLAYQKIIAEREVAVAKSRYHPQVRLNATYYDTDRDYDDLRGSTDPDYQYRYWTAGVSVSWDLFNGGKDFYQHQKYLKEIAWVDTRINETVNSIQSSIRVSFLALKEAQNRTDFAERAVKMATEYYTREKQRLNARISTLPAVLEAQAQLARAESNHNQVLLDYSLALAELNYSTGYREAAVQPALPGTGN